MATAAPAGGGGGGGGSHILREYLVALGFRVDERRTKGFERTLTTLDRGANALARSLVTAGTSAVTLAFLFTRSMERIFYSARYADTTVAKLQAMEFAGRNIGLAGGEMTAGLKSMAGALRANPGLVGMLNKLGVPVQGRDMSDVMWDFVRATKSMPFYVAQQYAEMFGISPEMLFNMQKGEEEATKAMERRKQLAKDMGVDADELAKSSVELSNLWRDVTEHASLFGQAVLQDAMPFVRELAGVTHQVLDDWKKISTQISQKGWGDFWQRLREGIGGRPEGERVKLTPEARARSGGQLSASELRLQEQGKLPQATEDVVDAVTDYTDFQNKKRVEEPPKAEGGGVDRDHWDPQNHLRDLEKKYGLPPGLLDRMWEKESSRGMNMRSKAGAKGHFQFMGPTAKQYGIEGQEDDFLASSDAAGRYMSDLLKWSKGDLRKALAGYNWGMGNVQKYSLGKAPAETQGYMDIANGLGGGDVNVNTEININGVSDPARAAEIVKQKQSDVAGSVVRNMRPRVN